MTIAWIAGFLLSILSILLLKNMRYDGEPILVMWIAIALVIFSVIPIANLLIGTIAVLYVAAAFLIEDDVTWKNQKEYGRLLKFLHRKIS